MTIRRQIIATARSWLYTPFIHQGRKKGEGCDCIGLILGIAAELKLKSKLGGDLCSYDSLEYHYLQDAWLLPQFVFKHFEHTELAIGSIVLLRGTLTGWHIGIIGEYVYNKQQYVHYTLIHACMKRRMVIEYRLSQHLLLNASYFKFQYNEENYDYYRIKQQDL